MTRHARPRLFVMVVLGVVGMVVGMASGSPAAIALAAPFVALLVLGGLTHRWPDLDVTVHFDPGAAVEGDVVDLVFELVARTGASQVEVGVDLPPALAPADGTVRRIVTAADHASTVVRLPVRSTTWGLLGPSRVTIRCADRYGLFLSSTVLARCPPLRVHPSGARRRALLAPSRLRAQLGAHLSAERSTGCEFADLRPVAVGDSLRSVNWRVSGRRGELWVNERHPERSSDVVVVIDSVRDLGTDEWSTLDASVRAAIAVIDCQIGVHDRVGMMALGGGVRWIAPAVGRNHFSRLVEAVLACEAEHSIGGPPLHALPWTRLPPRSLVVALSPMVTERVAEALLEMRRRRHEVAVVLLGVDDRLGGPGSFTDELARRLFLLERRDRVDRLRRNGVTVVDWDGLGSLDRVIPLLARGRRRRAS